RLRPRPPIGDHRARQRGHGRRPVERLERPPGHQRGRALRGLPVPRLHPGPGGANGFYQIFLRDRGLRPTIRVSAGPGGARGNGDSLNAALSASGRFVAFDSIATNLIPGDTNAHRDVFVYDLVLGTLTRASVGTNGTQANFGGQFPALSADGRFVAFESNALNLGSGAGNGFSPIYVHDRNAVTATRVSVDSLGVQGGHNSFHPAIRGDGRVVVFHSFASNLFPGDTNNAFDVFAAAFRTDPALQIQLNQASFHAGDTMILTVTSCP